MANTHEHLEHAEHGAHHAQDPFDRRVAVSVAIVAAVLAGIAMLGHRKHNDVLQLQGDANRLTTEASVAQTKANIDHTHATDQWGFYQAKNIREHMYTANLGLLDVAAKDPGKAQQADALRTKMQGQVKKYQAELEGMMAKAKDLAAAGDAKQQEALKPQGEARAKVDESHHAHHQADRLDYAHLGAEIGIVLCSLALLTKRKAFWLAGILSVALALALTVSAFAIPHDTHSPSSAGGEPSH